MSTDIELKLALTPKQLAQLRAHALLRGYQRPGRNRSKRVHTYFDTPQLLLRDNAIVLGLEQSGEHSLQTVVSRGDSAHFATSEISGDAPDVARIPDRRWRKLLSRGGRKSKLTPVFSTEVERNRIPLQVNESRIDVAFDVGHIRANGREQPICEARLALVAGQPERLYQLALELHDSVPFKLEHRDRIGRDYGLLADDHPAALRASLVKYAPDASVGAAFHAMAQAGFAHLCGNEDAILRSGDPDAVHQMRVAVRRLRALLSAFRSVLDSDATRFLRGELTWLQRQLGPARDWDVFIQTTLNPLAAGLNDEHSLDDLRQAAEQARHDAYGVARDTLQNRRYTRLLLKLQLWLDSMSWEGKDAPAALREPMLSLAEKILDKRHRRLVKRGDRFAQLNEAEMHDVRLRAKKLRYAAEFFYPLFPAKTMGKFVQALIEIQDTLGTLHDAIVGRELLAILRSPKAQDRKNVESPHRAAELERAAGIAAGFQAARINDDIRHFGEVWPRLTKFKTFWHTA